MSIDEKPCLDNLRNQRQFMNPELEALACQIGKLSLSVSTVLT